MLDQSALDKTKRGDELKENRNSHSYHLKCVPCRRNRQMHILLLACELTCGRENPDLVCIPELSGQQGIKFNYFWIDRLMLGK